jgi:hypothetical protein
MWVWQCNNVFLLPAFKSMNLLQNVTSTVNEVCKRLRSESAASTTGSARAVANGRVVPSSVHAIKNGRRKMEDRHVVMHDLNLIFADHSPQVRPRLPLSIGRSRRVCKLLHFRISRGHAANLI